MRLYAKSARYGFAVLIASATLAGCESKQAAVTVPAAPPTLAANQAATTQAAQKASAERPKLRPGARTAVLAAAGDRQYDKTFDDLRFEMTVGDKFQRPMLTDAIEALNGQKIRIRGYILPTPQKHGIQQFVLVRDNQECCFGPGAALYDCILVEMQPGKTADFTIRPIAVEGTFDIREFVIDGKHLAIYHMAAESAR